MLGDREGQQLNRYVKDYVIFDLETTGISVKRDEIVEISAVKVIDSKVVDEFTSLVNPLIPIPYGASSVNGITDDMVKDAPMLVDVMPEFLEFVGKMILVGHNIKSFDMKFIYRDCRKIYGKIPDNEYIDTLRFSRTVLPDLAHHALGDLASYYGISTIGAHRALNDCRMNQKVFEKLNEEVTKTTDLQSSTLRICPVCGEFLKKRNGRYGEFFGCMGYPNCRYTENCTS